MDVQITGNSLIIKILDYREIIEPNYFENLKEEFQRFKSEYEKPSNQRNFDRKRT